MKCGTCGLSFKHSKCEFCCRREIWQDEKMKEVISNLFNPRLQEALLKFDFDMSSFAKQIDVLNLNKGSGLFVTGKSGTGKTTYVAALTLEACRKRFVHKLNYRWETFHFLSTSKLFQQFKDTYDNFSQENQSQIMSKYQNCAWLVIDDLGAERNNSWTYDVLYSLINHRYEYLKTTLFTSNCSLTGLFDIFGDDRISSRIGESCAVRSFTKSRRKSAIDPFLLGAKNVQS